MQVISATETTQTLAAIIDKAQGEPVVVRQENRDIAVIMSMEDYQRLTQFNIQEFQQFRENMGCKAQERGLTEDKLQEILATDES